MYLKRSIKYILYIFFMLLIIVTIKYNYLRKSNWINSLFNNSILYDSYIINNNIAYTLNIHKINLKKTVYKINSKRNKLNNGLLLLKDEKNLIILASHSGLSPISSFNQLDKLNINDIIELSKNNHTYYYNIFSIYQINKNGYLKIQKYNYPVIYLISCNKKDKTKQEIYIGRLTKYQ